jgi:hypothetical protein
MPASADSSAIMAPSTPFLKKLHAGVAAGPLVMLPTALQHQHLHGNCNARVSCAKQNHSHCHRHHSPYNRWLARRTDTWLRLLVGNGGLLTIMEETEA